MAVLIIIWLSYAYRLGYYIWYQTPEHMCEFLVEHEKWFAAMQAFVDILGEAIPLMVVFTMQVLKVCCKPKKRSKKYIDPNDTLNSHHFDESRDMGVQQASEDHETNHIGSNEDTKYSALNVKRSSERVAEIIKKTKRH